MFTSFLIAISLNFDTFSVAIIQGAQNRSSKLGKSIIVALFFGIGQGLMAQVGALFGFGFKLIITDIDHWIAFLLLTVIGMKMIGEKETKIVQKEKGKKLNYATLICLVVATSIDSLIVGISLAFIKESIIIEVITIAVVSFFASFIGYHLGEKLRTQFKNKIKVFGGFILILIGIKILIEHLFSF
jgi:manganese efflux pump family protein